MTITRKYYKSLIEIFEIIGSIQPNEVNKFYETKIELANLINRIHKFNLFPLTFSESFFMCLHKKTIDNFLKEKLELMSELHYELSECLYTARLRFGGELLYYLFEINIKVLNLSIAELNEYEKIKKEPDRYDFSQTLKFTSEVDKSELIKKLKSEQRKSKVIKEKIIIKEKEYEQVETKLQEYLAPYKEYIFTNYPSISNLFSFYSKKIRAYLTEAGSKDIFELRLHSYEAVDGDTSVILKHEYYDFYSAYFFNLEEITDKQVAASAILLRKEDLSFDNIFTIEQIHRGLINAFLQNANDKEVIEFTEFVFKCEGYKFYITTLTSDLGFDLYAQKDGKNFTFEIFHHKPRSSDILLERINSFKNKAESYSEVFVFSSYPGHSIVDLLKANHITSINLLDLIGKHFSLDNSQIIHWYIQSKLHVFKLQHKANNTFFEADTLIKRLEKCPAGDRAWSDYEKIGIDIFKFLFEDNFKSYIAEEQVENDLRNHRRDLIVSNYYRDPSSFWAGVKQEYKANAIIIDFKNYSEKLSSSTFFSVSKYTNKKVGNFAIVFSRNGIDKTAKNEQKTLLSDGKLLIEFDDNELKEMIREKTIGKDPIDRLKSKEFELVKRN